MESQGSSSGAPENHEAETQVQDVTSAAQADAQAGASGAASPGKHFLDRFGRGSIAAFAAVAGLIVGAGGMAALGDDHDGPDHHGPEFGFNGGSMRDGWVEHDRRGGPGGPGGPPAGPMPGGAPAPPGGAVPPGAQGAPGTQGKQAPQGGGNR